MEDSVGASWPFATPAEADVLTTVGILQGHAILYVTRDVDDGCWQFLDGQCLTGATARVIAFGILVARHPTLQELAALLPGGAAWREAANQPWHQL